MASASEYSYECLNTILALLPALVAAKELGLLRELLTHSLVPMFLDDQFSGLRSAPISFMNWESDDGHRYSTIETWKLLVRAVMAMAEEEKAGKKRKKN